MQKYGEKAGIPEEKRQDGDALIALPWACWLLRREGREAGSTRALTYYDAFLARNLWARAIHESCSATRASHSRSR